jgi:hypothetical protein
MRFAHRFLLLWGIIATLCFAIAAMMTWAVVRVYAPSSPRMIGIYGDYRLKNATGTIEYNTTERPVWIVTFPAGSRFVILPGAPTAVCEDARSTFGNGPLGTLEGVEQGTEPRLPQRLVHRWHGPPPFDVYQIDVGRLQSSQIGGRIACFISLSPNRETLTSSSLGLDYMLLTGTDVTSPAGFIRVSVTVPNAEQMQIYGGTASSAGGTNLTPGTQATFKYANAQQEGTRDILFILIGTFIALGAATTLEAIRPYVELLARRGDKGA